MARSAADKVATIDDDLLGDTQAAAAPAAKEIVPTQVAGAEVDPELSGRKVKLTIFEQEGDMGKQPVYVGHNGYGYLIKRGEPVIVPLEVVNVLNDAKITELETQQGGKQVERSRPRFAFQVDQSFQG